MAIKNFDVDAMERQIGAIKCDIDPGFGLHKEYIEDIIVIFLKLGFDVDDPGKPKCREDRLIQERVQLISKTIRSSLDA